MQVDFVLAYLQANMVFVEFLASWKPFLPEHVHKWIGRPLLLKKALYGYNYSGKFLYQDQADFLMSEGFAEAGLPGLWVKHLLDRGFLLFLHYSDDILVAGNKDGALQQFVDNLRKRFDVEVRPRADWYLQTRIQQDKDLNIVLDQSRYAKAMVTRFLPQFASEPTEAERERYASPVKTTTRFTKEDVSPTLAEVEELEHENGFRFIELAGCFCGH